VPAREGRRGLGAVVAKPGTGNLVGGKTAGSCWLTRVACNRKARRRKRIFVIVGTPGLTDFVRPSPLTTAHHEIVPLKDGKGGGRRDGGIVRGTESCEFRKTFWPSTGSFRVVMPGEALGPCSATGGLTGFFVIEASTYNQTARRPARSGPWRGEPANFRVRARVRTLERTCCGGETAEPHGRG